MMSSYFFREKKWVTTFLVNVLKSNEPLLVIVSTPTLSALQVIVRFSSIFCKFSRKKIRLSSGCHPLDGVTRGGPPPFYYHPSSLPLVTPLVLRRLTNWRSIRVTNLRQAPCWIRPVVWGDRQWSWLRWPPAWQWEAECSASAPPTTTGVLQVPPARRRRCQGHLPVTTSSRTWPASMSYWRRRWRWRRWAGCESSSALNASRRTSHESRYLHWFSRSPTSISIVLALRRQSRLTTLSKLFTPLPLSPSSIIW